MRADAPDLPNGVEVVVSREALLTRAAAGACLKAIKRETPWPNRHQFELAWALEAALEGGPAVPTTVAPQAVGA